MPAWPDRWRRRETAWAYAVVGFLAVAGPIAAWGAVVGPGSRDQASVLAAYLGLLGAITAVIFWLLARPDRAAGR